VHINVFGVTKGEFENNKVSGVRCQGGKGVRFQVSTNDRHGAEGMGFKVQKGFRL
jgi:hypothetical protein